MEGRASEGVGTCRGFSMPCESLRAPSAVLCPRSGLPGWALGAVGRSAVLGWALGSDLHLWLLLPAGRGAMRGFTALLSALLSPDASLLRGRVWLFKESQGFKVISGACSTELNAFFPFSSFFFFKPCALFFCSVSLLSGRLPLSGWLLVMFTCNVSIWTACPQAFSPSAGAAGAGKPRWTWQVSPGRTSRQDPRPFLLAAVC